MRFVWFDTAWEEYISWQKDKQKFRKINELLKDIKRNGYKCIGRPERLSGNLAKYSSIRIDEKNRIVFRIEKDDIEIIQCGSHYRDK